MPLDYCNKLDSLENVLLKKRAGINESLFTILKFRTMKMDTLKDSPTHFLKDPDHYITRFECFFRKSRFDELSQISQFVSSKMSIINQRKAPWNQFELTTERNKYDVNVARHWLTDWAQINKYCAQR